MVVKRGDYFFRFNNDGDNQELLYLANWHKYFNEEYPTLNSLLSKGDNVVDIGANLGFFTLMISRIIGNEGKIFCFEPSLLTYNKLISNLKINEIQNAYPENFGIGSKDGHYKLKRNKKYSGLSSIVVNNSNHVYEEEIKVTTLDNYFLNKNVKIDLIKIDTEGFEPEVLRGAEKVIKNYKPIICIELGGGKFLKSSTEAMQILNQFGYRLPINASDLGTISSGKNFIAKFHG